MDLNRKRILIVKPSSLGDVVHTLPLAHAIKRCFPSCFIGWVVQKAFAPILENDPAIDEIVPIFIPSTSDPQAPRGAFIWATRETIRVMRSLRKRFRVAPYDVILDLHASFRSGLIGRSNPGGLRIGFAAAKELNTWFQHRHIAPGKDKIHAVDENLAFGDELGCPAVAEDFRIHPGQAARDRVVRFLKDKGIDDPSRLVYANPAARWETKFWTVEAWAELADLLIEQAGATVIFCGSPADVPHIQQITGRMRRAPVVSAGELNLAEAVALGERCDVYVGVDSGPMHFAALAGTKVVALFGPTDPARVGPYGEGHTVIRRTDLDCLGCRKRACGNRKCLEGITARTVFEAVTPLLG